jgi:hypothetical protein
MKHMLYHREVELSQSKNKMYKSMKNQNKLRMERSIMHMN